MNIEQLKDNGIPEEILNILKSRGISKLESFQEEAINNGLLEGKNLFVSAPTTTGKTLVGELALVKKACSMKGCFYVVSHKALAEEKYKIFKETYESTNWFNVAITTGDRSRFDDNLGSYGIVISTYEKLSQLIISNPHLLNAVNLVVIDEIQMLADSSRGATLESLLIKIKSKKDIQIIALSATVSNQEDLANWLGCKLITTNQRSIELLETLWTIDKIIKRNYNSNEFSEEPLPVSNLDTIEILRYLKANEFLPVLVFAMTKKDVENLAQKYSRYSTESDINLDIIRRLKDSSESTPTTKLLCNLISKGIGIHSSDLTELERDVIEEAYRKGQLSAIFSTTTLSTGINLPAKSVLIDKCIREWDDYPEIDVHECCP